MKLLSVVGSALSRTGSVWMETLLFAVFIVPVILGGLEVLSRGGDVRILQAALLVPQALFTGFSAVVLYQAFDNQLKDEPVELPMGRLFSLTVSISLATFLVNIIVGIGSSFCLIPGLFAMTALFLTQVTLFKEDTKVLDALYQSWGKTEGHRLDIFFLLLLVYTAAMIITIPVVAGAISMLYADLVGGGQAGGLAVKVGLATLFGVVIAFGLSFSRALEYTVYAEISPSVDRWLRPVVDSVVPIEPAGPTQPDEPPRERVQPAMRAPITVDQDIVFGQDAEDDKDGW